MNRRVPNVEYRNRVVRGPAESMQGRMEKPDKKELLTIGKIAQQEGMINNLTSEVRILKQKLTFLQKVKFDGFREEISQGDVRFILDNGKTVIKAHRFILACKSSMFRKMFDTDMKEKTSGEIYIKDISAPVLQAVIDFLYTAEITFSVEVRAVEVFKVAHRFDIPELQTQCEIELLKSVNSENVSDMLRLSHVYGLGGLRAKSVKVFKENFDQIHSKVINDLLS